MDANDQEQPERRKQGPGLIAGPARRRASAKGTARSVARSAPRSQGAATHKASKARGKVGRAGRRDSARQLLCSAPGPGPRIRGCLIIAIGAAPTASWGLGS